MSKKKVESGFNGLQAAITAACGEMDRLRKVRKEALEAIAGYSDERMVRFIMENPPEMVAIRGKELEEWAYDLTMGELRMMVAIAALGKEGE